MVEGTKAASQTIFGAKAADYFATKTRELINEKSSKFVNASTKYVDIIKDVINELPVRWMSDTGVVSPWSKNHADFTSLCVFVPTDFDGDGEIFCGCRAVCSLHLLYPRLKSEPLATFISTMTR